MYRPPAKAINANNKSGEVNLKYKINKTTTKKNRMILHAIDSQKYKNKQIIALEI